MTFFLGNQGNIKLRRGSSAQFGSIQGSINTDDVNTTLNRVGFDQAVENLLTGDRVEIGTSDARGLAFFPASTWTDYTVQKTISLFVHVNAVGGLRFFRTFADAINNTRAAEVPVTTFAGGTIEVTVSVRDVTFNILGCIESYEFSTDRESIDITSLSDKFRQQYSAGLISGSGRINCSFSYETSDTSEPALLVMQIIQRVEIGSECQLGLYLTDQAVDPLVETVFYELTAVITRAGIQVGAGQAIGCAIDFVTTGEIRLIYGRPSDYILKEDTDRINLEQSLDFLLSEATD
jgi:hypothetical protein